MAMGLYAEAVDLVAVDGDGSVGVGFADAVSEFWGLANGYYCL